MRLWDGFEVDFFGNLNAYVWLKIQQKTTTMYLVFLIVVWCGILQSTGVLCEFPGLRRPPNNWPGEQKDDSVEFLTRLRALMMEHNARLKLMQQLEQLTKEKEQLEQEVSYPVVDDNRKIEELPDVSDYAIFLIVVWCGILQSTGVLCEFPGLRRPPNNWPGEQKDDSVEFLTRLRALMMEHNARLKLMQQLEQLTKEKEQLEQEVSYPVVDDNRKIEELPDVSDYTSVDASKESIFKSTQFAYSPTDPRYWYPESYVNKVKQQIKAQQPTGEDDYESEKKETETKSNVKSQITTIDAVPTFNVKAPMIPNPKLHIPKQVKIDNNNNAVETGNSDTKLQQQQQQQGVIQKPMNLDDGGIGILVVAMIAGVSAAITVAIIAAGLGYYTLRKKIKAAADVDYPAYGVTGPNKDLLYPNEKKFAQSVDMFHYQQQKQKKNSLENKSNGETNDGFSDLDGEFDMDDGDYTVYECPGFAPTGEMEVKNPLFADEPITVAQKHQPDAETTEDVAGSANVKSIDERQKTTKKSPKNISPNTEKASSKKK
uniref:CSON004060 protein n=2 Tax=Culicoides sonorensis TaxID=179676 RepID=A0A336MQJ0_CULSO